MIKKLKKIKKEIKDQIYLQDSLTTQITLNFEVIRRAGEEATCSVYSVVEVKQQIQLIDY